MKLFNKVFYFFTRTKIYVLGFPKNPNEFHVKRYEHNLCDIGISIYGSFSFDVSSKHFHIYSFENHEIQKNDYKNKSLLDLFKDLKESYFQWHENRMGWTKINL